MLIGGLRLTPDKDIITMQRGIRATALHPGGIMTELLRHTSMEMLQEMVGERFPVAQGL